MKKDSMRSRIIDSRITQRSYGKKRIYKKRIYTIKAYINHKVCSRGVVLLGLFQYLHSPSLLILSTSSDAVDLRTVVVVVVVFVAACSSVVRVSRNRWATWWCFRLLDITLLKASAALRRWESTTSTRQTTCKVHSHRNRIANRINTSY